MGLSGRRTAIISNGTREQQAAKVSRLGLPQLVDTEIYSEDIGTNKRDRAIFDRGLLELGVRPEESIIVRDPCHVDIKGGRRGGMFTWWLRRGAYAGVLRKSRTTAGLHDWFPNSTGRRA